MLSMTRTPAASGEPAKKAGQQRIELAVTLAGGRALSFLENSTAGRVLHVFDHSAYLENQTGGLACLGGPIIGAAPLNAVVALDGCFPGWRLLLEEGDPISFRGKSIQVGSKVALDCHEARLWRPELPTLPIRPHLLAVHLEGLRAACSTGAPHQGLGFLLTGQVSPAVHTPRGVDQLLAARAGAALAALEGWLRRSLQVVGGGAADRLAADRNAADRMAAPPPEEAAGLIGLGPGLTPSGDDLIGGMLIAMHAIGRPGLADALGGWAISLARARSTRISLAHLSAARHGEGAAPLHGVLNGLGRDTEWTPEGVFSDPFFKGHNSGWDALVGIMAVMSNLPAANDPRYVN